MTGIEFGVHKVISGLGFLPESDQQGCFRAMAFLKTIFSPGRQRPASEQTGIREIEDGLMTLVKQVGVSVLNREAMSRKFSLVAAAAEKLHPDFVAKFRRAMGA